MHSNPIDLLKTTTALFETPGPKSSVAAPIPKVESASNKDVPNSGPVFLRKAAGKVWNDPTLAQWPQNDHR